MYLQICPISSAVLTFFIFKFAFDEFTTCSITELIMQLYLTTECLSKDHTSYETKNKYTFIVRNYLLVVKYLL